MLYYCNKYNFENDKSIVYIYVCSSKGVPGGVGGRYGTGRSQRNLNFLVKTPLDFRNAS